MREILERAAAIAGDRQRGASELVAELLPILQMALSDGIGSTVEVARLVCHGQPAMAVLWNVCGAAIADFTNPGRFATVRAQVERAPAALERAASAALRDALGQVAKTENGAAPLLTFGDKSPLLLTLSYSRSVVRVLAALQESVPLRAVCAESWPGGEGKFCAEALAGAGLEIEVVADALITTYLPAADAVVVGADAVAAEGWTNKAGTFGLAAAAWFAGVPVYVISSRDKAESALLRGRMALPRIFERTPAQLATLFLTDAGPVAPDALPQLTERFASDLNCLLAHIF